MWIRKFFAVIAVMVLLLLMDVALADISVFERKTINWSGYDPYIISFPVLACAEYNYNNGPLTQDLTLKDIPSEAVLLPNSYGQILKEGIQIQIEHGPEITKNSYIANSLTLDLPRSGTSGNNCKGIFYLVFSIPSPPTTITNTTTSLPSTSTTTISTTTTSLPIQQTSFIDGIVNTVRQFFRSLFGWLGNNI